MGQIANLIPRLIDNPKLILNRLYYTATGTSVGDLRDRIEDYRETFNTLLEMSRRAGDAVRVLPLDSFLDAHRYTNEAEELAALFDAHGSDKATKHNYHLVYAELLGARKNDACAILEIGLGTNNTQIRSNMGAQGKPGASVRAFRDWGKRFMLCGADIDAKILFSEERIRTYHVDQTDPATLAELALKLAPLKFDLIIDDGLHMPWANLNTLNFALPLLAPDGAFVIEDIVDGYIPVWNVIAKFIPADYAFELIKCKSESVCIVRKRMA